MKDNLITDLSTLTTIPKVTLQELCNLACQSIAHCATNLDLDDVAEVDIGMGNLYIGRYAGEVRYKFVPSPTLEHDVNLALSGNSPLIKRCEDTLVSRITNTYKTMF